MPTESELMIAILLLIIISTWFLGVAINYKRSADSLRRKMRNKNRHG